MPRWHSRSPQGLGVIGLAGPWKRGCRASVRKTRPAHGIELSVQTQRRLCTVRKEGSGVCSCLLTVSAETEGLHWMCLMSQQNVSIRRAPGYSIGRRPFMWAMCVLPGRRDRSKQRAPLRLTARAASPRRRRSGSRNAGSMAWYGRMVGNNQKPPLILGSGGARLLARSDRRLGRLKLQSRQRVPGSQGAFHP